MNILITGGTGFIGTALIDYMHKQGHQMTVFTRNKQLLANAHVQAIDDLSNLASDTCFDVIVNLAGATISKRWTSTYKQTLLDSRLQVTQSVNQLVQNLQHKPRCIISASAVGFYGDQGSKVVTEATQPQMGFTHTLCHTWEQEALKAQQWGCQVAIIRLGVVLGLGQGILKETMPMFSKGLGGKLGHGNQYLSWVHIDDVVAAINFLMTPSDEDKVGEDKTDDKQELPTVYNLTAPNPVTNNQWTQALAASLNKPALLPLPSAMVKLMFGEMGETLLLQGQKVLPEQLLKAGFQFNYPRLSDALDELIN